MSERFTRLQRSMELALNHEWPQLERTTRRVATLQPRPIQEPSDCDRAIVATVATDGGESRLKLDPIRIQVIRVADSRGAIYFEELIPQSLEPDEIIRFFFAGQERLQRLLSYLGLSWEQLLPRTDYQRSHLVAMLRELLEWAATLKLAAEARRLLLLHDGLLRSVLLNDHVFGVLRERLADLTRRRDHLLVGVAKRSAVISYLSVALGMGEVASGAAPVYLPVPAEMEREAAPSQYRWIGQRSMGQLYIARLDRGDSVPLMPVDIADWQQDQADQIMSMLHRSSQASFPLRGYPQELVAAHQHARLGELETEMLESMLTNLIVERNPTLAEQVRQLRLVGERLVEEIEDVASAES